MKILVDVGGSDASDLLLLSKIRHHDTAGVKPFIVVFQPWVRWNKDLNAYDAAVEVYVEGVNSPIVMGRKGFIGPVELADIFYGVGNTQNLMVWRINATVTEEATTLRTKSSASMLATAKAYEMRDDWVKGRGNGGGIAQPVPVLV